MWVAHARRGTWRCKVRFTEFRSTEEYLAKQRDRYYTQPGYKISRALLLGRRRKALKRQREREAQHG